MAADGIGHRDRIWEFPQMGLLSLGVFVTETCFSWSSRLGSLI